MGVSSRARERGGTVIPQITALARTRLTRLLFSPGINANRTSFWEKRAIEYSAAYPAWPPGATGQRFYSGSTRAPVASSPYWSQRQTSTRAKFA